MRKKVTLRLIKPGEEKPRPGAYSDREGEEFCIDVSFYNHLMKNGGVGTRYDTHGNQINIINYDKKNSYPYHVADLGLKKE